MLSTGKPSYMTIKLPPAPPSVLDEAGQPRCGRYSGTVAAIDWARLRAPYAHSALWRHFHHKRWQYLALATEKLFCGIAIVDLGWTSTAFAYAFERTRGQEIASYSQDGIPGISASVSDRPADGAASRFSFFRQQIKFQQSGAAGHYDLSLRCGRFQIDAECDASGAAPFLLAVGPILGGACHATQKSSGIALRGQARVGEQAYSLDGGVASFDYSNGLLARQTAWRWASAHSMELGFNVQAGYFGTQENVLWLDGQLYPLGNAHFDYDADNPMAAWHIHTDDGLLYLQFLPEGARYQNKNLLIAVSRYVQPIGTFTGWVRQSRNAPKRRVERLVGVTEDHFSRW
jgi:hypothetical protein